MEADRSARPPAAAIVGLVVALMFLALGTAALLFGGGVVVGAIALAGGALTLAASIFVWVRPLRSR